MGKLKKLELEIGTVNKRKALTQTQVDTLLHVYNDTALEKHISGYVSKDELTTREYYNLTQLGLNVTCAKKNATDWSVFTDKKLLKAGEHANIIVGGQGTNEEVTMTIDNIKVNFGKITADELKPYIELNGSQLTFKTGLSVTDIMAEITIKVVPRWDKNEIKAVVVNVGITSSLRTVWINPAGNSAALRSEGSLDLLEDYISRSKPYVLTADGKKMAEIKSATFSGDYNGGTGVITFKDGTQKTVEELNATGCNFMVYRPEMHIFSGTDENGKEILQNFGVYPIKEGKTFNARFIGMFHAYNQDGVLKSQPNRVPTRNQTIAQFQSQAKMGAVDYGLWNYNDWCKENALHLSYFANTNYENNIGVGRINDWNNVCDIRTGWTLPMLGVTSYGTYPTVNRSGGKVNCLNFFGLEGVGEQVWDFVIGFRHDETTCYVWNDNNWEEDHAGDRTFKLAVTNVDQNYIGTIIAGADFDMLPRSVNASSSTGYCDGHWVSTSGRLLLVGGAAYVGSICGLSASAADGGFGGSDASSGARLAFYGRPVEVDGANLI